MNMMNILMILYSRGIIIDMLAVRLPGPGTGRRLSRGGRKELARRRAVQSAWRGRAVGCYSIS